MTNFVSAKWDCVYSLELSKNANNYKKIVRVNKLENDGMVKTYVDVRNYNQKNATKNGVCLTPHEFKWIIKQWRQNKKTSRMENQSRQLKLAKFGLDGSLISLET